MPVDLLQLRDQVERARLHFLGRIDAVPIAALVWGPNPTSTDPIAITRVELRNTLRARGHLAEFSEDLYDPKSPRSLFAQQIAQAEAYDIVFTMPSSFGSIGEIHDFARIPGLSHKVVAFVDKSYAK